MFYKYVWLLCASFVLHTLSTACVVIYIACFRMAGGCVSRQAQIINERSKSNMFPSINIITVFCMKVTLFNYPGVHLYNVYMYQVRIGNYIVKYYSGTV